MQKQSQSFFAYGGKLYYICGEFNTATYCNKATEFITYGWALCVWVLPLRMTKVNPQIHTAEILESTITDSAGLFHEDKNPNTMTRTSV